MELLNIEIYKIDLNRNDRKELETIIMSNYFIMLCINDMTNANFKITELLEMLTKTNEDESVTVLSANNRLLYDRKKQRFKLQIENEITVNEKFRFTSINDVLYDTFYFYLGLFSNQTDYYYKNLIYPEIEDEIAFSPTQSVNPL